MNNLIFVKSALITLIKLLTFYTIYANNENNKTRKNKQRKDQRHMSEKTPRPKLNIEQTVDFNNDLQDFNTKIEGHGVKLSEVEAIDTSDILSRRLENNITVDEAVAEVVKTVENARLQEGALVQDGAGNQYRIAEQKKGDNLFLLRVVEPETGREKLFKKSDFIKDLSLVEVAEQDDGEKQSGDENAPGEAKSSIENDNSREKDFNAPHKPGAYTIGKDGRPEPILDNEQDQDNPTSTTPVPAWAALPNSMGLTTPIPIPAPAPPAPLAPTELARRHAKQEKEIPEKKKSLWRKIGKKVVAVAAGLAVLAGGVFVGIKSMDSDKDELTHSVPAATATYNPAEERAPVTASDITNIEAESATESGAYDLNNTIDYYKLGDVEPYGYGPALPAEHDALVQEMTTRTQHSPELTAAWTATCFAEKMNTAEAEACLNNFKSNPDAWKEAGNNFSSMLHDEDTTINFMNLDGNMTHSSYMDENGHLVVTNIEASGTYAHIVNAKYGIDTMVRLDCGGQVVIVDSEGNATVQELPGISIPSEKVTPPTDTNTTPPTDTNTTPPTDTNTTDTNTTPPTTLEQKDPTQNINENPNLNSDAYQENSVDVNTNEGNQPDTQQDIAPDNGLGQEPETTLEDTQTSTGEISSETETPDVQEGGQEVTNNTGDVVDNTGATHEQAMKDVDAVQQGTNPGSTANTGDPGGQQ